MAGVCFLHPVHRQYTQRIDASLIEFGLRHILSRGSRFWSAKHAWASVEAPTAEFTGAARLASAHGCPASESIRFGERLKGDRHPAGSPREEIGFSHRRAMLARAL